jgi:hypothetical protein
MCLNVYIYKKLNPKFNNMTDIELQKHYINIGKQTNENFFKFDYDITNYNKNEFVNNPFFTNRYYIYKITTKNELIAQYPRKIYICNKEVFKLYYKDFDFEYYKNRYFNGIEISDYEIMEYHHLIGKNNGNSINSKIKVVIYTPPLDINCGGIICMHYLAKLLNDNNILVKLFVYNGITYSNIFCNNFAHIDEIDENTIVIYPCIISGNPLGAKRVVIWMLLELGIEMPLDHWKNWGPNDLVYYWETKENTKQLCCPWFNPIFTNRNKNGPRNNTCYLIKKGRLIHKNIKHIHPPESICLDHNDNLYDLSNIFNNCKYFYCYDPNSAFSIFAAVCGCISIIYPINSVNAHEYFKNRMYNYDGKLYNKGIVYGNDLELIKSCEREINNLDEYYQNLFNMYHKSVNKFIDDLYNWDSLLNTTKNIYDN